MKPVRAIENNASEQQSRSEQVSSTHRHHERSDVSSQRHHREHSEVSSSQRHHRDHSEVSSTQRHHRDHSEVSSTQGHHREHSEVSSTYRRHEQESSTYRHHERRVSFANRHHEHEVASTYQQESHQRRDYVTKDTHHEHNANHQNGNRTQIVHSNERETNMSPSTSQPMYESLDDVIYKEEHYKELPLPDSVDPDVSYHSKWPPKPELTRTRHNLVEIPSDDSSISSSPSPPSVIEMVIHHGNDEGITEDLDSYPPPPENFM